MPVRDLLVPQPGQDEQRHGESHHEFVTGEIFQGLLDGADIEGLDPGEQRPQSGDDPTELVAKPLNHANCPVRSCLATTCARAGVCFAQSESIAWR